MKNVLWIVVLTVIVAQSDGAINYLMNADMETHWEVVPVMNLQYTGTGADCRLNVDVANHRFQTIVDSTVDIDVDLSDRVNFECQAQLIAYLNATGRYTASTASWMGRNRGTDGWGPTHDYSDGWNGAFNLKDGSQVVEGSPSYWGTYGGSSNGASMFAHSGKFSLGVYDNRPDGNPASPLYNVAPESVNYSQNVSTGNPDHWAELIGQEVKLSGWAYMPSNSWQNPSVDQGYSVRVHHGAGGGSITDFSSNPGRDQWVYFENTFTVDPGSDTLLVVLFANMNPAHVYAGQGSVYFDDMAMEIIPEPATMALLGLGIMGMLRRRKR